MAIPERGLVMVAHGLLIGVIIYFVMVMVFKQPKEMAEDRSVLIAAFVVIYMVLFGHGAPTTVNKNISFF